MNSVLVNIALILLFIGVAVLFPNPIIFLIILFGGMETWRRWKERKSPEAQESRPHLYGRRVLS